MDKENLEYHFLGEYDCNNKYTNNELEFLIPNKFTNNLNDNLNNPEKILGICLKTEYFTYGSFKKIYKYSTYNNNGEVENSYIIFEQEKPIRNLNSDKIMKSMKTELNIQYHIQKYYPKIVPKLYSTVYFLNTNKTPVIQAIMQNIRFLKFISLGEYVYYFSADLKQTFFNKDFLDIQNLGELKKKIDNKTIYEYLDKFYINELHNSFFQYLFLMHLCNVFHHDLHYENIFIENENEKDYKFKFIDFGFATKIKDKNTVEKIVGILEKWSKGHFVTLEEKYNIVSLFVDEELKKIDGHNKSFKNFFFNGSTVYNTEENKATTYLQKQINKNLKVTCYIKKKYFGAIRNIPKICYSKSSFAISFS